MQNEPNGAERALKAAFDRQTDELLAKEEPALPYDPEKMKYPLPAAEAFQVGATLDFTMRIATNLLTSPAAAEVARAYGSPDVVEKVVGSQNFRGAPITPEEVGKVVARFAMATAEELIKLAEEKGTISAVPLFGTLLDEGTVSHARRIGAINVEQNVGVQMYGAVAARRAEVKEGPKIALATGHQTMHLGKST